MIKSKNILIENKDETKGWQKIINNFYENTWINNEGDFAG